MLFDLEDHGRSVSSFANLDVTTVLGDTTRFGSQGHVLGPSIPPVQRTRLLPVFPSFPFMPPLSSAGSGRGKQGRRTRHVTRPGRCTETGGAIPFLHGEGGRGCPGCALGGGER